MRASLSTLLPACAISVVSLFVCPPLAHAQRALDCDLVQNPNPTQSEERRIVSAAQELTQALIDGDVAGTQRARRDLLRPFTGCQDQSVAFRLAYGRVLAERLGSVALGEDVHKAVNALHAMGPVAIEETTDLLIDALADDRPAVRLAGATAIADTIQGATPTDRLRQQAMRALSAAAEQLADERDPAVAAALVSAMAVSNANQAMLRRSAELLAQALPRVVGDLPEDYDQMVWSKAISRAAVTLRGGVLNANPTQTDDAALMRRVSRGSAVIVGYVERLIAEREELSALADEPVYAILDDTMATVTSQLQLAARGLPSRAATLPNLQGAFRDAVERGDASILRSAMDEAGPVLDSMGVGQGAFDADAGR